MYPKVETGKAVWAQDHQSVPGVQADLRLHLPKQVLGGNHRGERKTAHRLQGWFQFALIDPLYLSNTDHRGWIPCSKHIPRIPCLSISNDALFKNCQHPATRVINLFSRKILVRRSASTSTRGLASVLLVTSASISTPIRMEGQQSSFFTHFYSFKFDEQSPLSSDNTPSSLYFWLSSTHFYPGK